jgi:predicted kinase
MPPRARLSPMSSSARDARGSRVRRASPGTRPLEGGGLLVIGGPPLGGKSVLAAYLAECLPYAVKIEAIDDLARSHAYWFPEGPGRRVTHVGTSAMLRRARQVWRAGAPGAAPTIIVVARFATKAERALARTVARGAGMRFLFVEACSDEERALHRSPMSMLSVREVQARLARYDAALRAYRRVEEREADWLPAVCLARVLANPKRAMKRVLDAW